MGLEKIEKRIREKSEKEIKAVEKKANEEAGQLDGSIQAEADRAHKHVVDKRRQELELIPKRIISNARMERKQQMDSRKAESVMNVFEEAKNEILKMSDSEKKNILKNLANDGKKHVNEPVIYVDKKYAKLISAKTGDIGDFGVVVESSDGSMKVDNTLNNVLGRMEPDLKSKVGKILFG